MRTPKENIRRDMTRAILMEPLASQLKTAADQPLKVIIHLNESWPGGVTAATAQILHKISPFDPKILASGPYCFAALTPAQITDLAEETRQQIRAGGRKSALIFRIWSDHEIRSTLTRSLVTVKADAAQRAFRALGENIVWAVLDSGIDTTHPHFAEFKNLEVPHPLAHTDFTEPDMPLEDPAGHGTHVAGIIAGHWKTTNPVGETVVGREASDENSDDEPEENLHLEPLTEITGVAPQCKILSLRVLDAEGCGLVSSVLRAIEYIRQCNQEGKRILIHGANLSLGYDFDPCWFACGQSPLCVEVNRLVRSGVNVVVSAGNGGYSSFLEPSGDSVDRYSNMSISDPGNADLAITVGSTHRDMPHTYGVSYFSSRGPTGDGRLKPDLLAPGERIISCAAGEEAKRFEPLSPNVLYCEMSGTSMSAPHVSGAIAAFLSVRPEFIGEPERVKRIFTSNTIDLHRDPNFQGTGLMDLMKVLQSV